MRRWYGAGPAHMVAMLACFAVAGHAAWLVVDDPAWPRMLAWFLGAAVASDLVLLPLAAGADRTLAAAARQRVPVRNHVRVPALGAALTFLLFLPGIIQQGEATLHAASGLDQDPFLGRWLLLAATMAASSAAVYGVRVLRAARAGFTRP